MWSSDLRRAVATARLAWGEPRQDARLREMSFGALEGLPWETLDPGLQEGLARFEGFAAPVGETLRRPARARPLLRGRAAPGRHVLFTHGGVVRLLSREVGEDHFVPTGTLLVVDWDGSAARLAPGRRGRGQPGPAGTAAEQEGR